MKLAIPVLALLLGGLAWLIRGGAAPEADAPRRPALCDQSVAAETRVPSSPSAVETAELRPKTIGAAAGLPAAVKRSPEPSAPLRTGYFKAALGLNAEQARQVSGILEDRSRAVAAYEAEVHQRGWLRMDDFDHRVGELRSLSYCRIAALLDAEQARTFEALWPAELLARDSILISTPEEKVVTVD